MDTEATEKLDKLQPFYGSLYRYRGINTHEQEADELQAQARTGKPSRTTRQRLEDLITKNLIFAAKPSKMNDPFECVPATPLDKVEDLQSAIDRAIKDSPDFVTPRGERRAMARRLAKKHSDPTIRQASMAAGFDEDMGIISFSKKWDSLTQWAYYSSDHYGVCLEFEIRENYAWWSVFKGKCFSGYEVAYTKKRPEFDISKVAAELHKGADSRNYLARAGISAVLGKSDEWIGEQEVRLLTNVSKEFSYPADALTGVYLGCRITDEAQNFILDCVARSVSDPIVYKCEKSLEHYSLVRKLVNC